MVLAFLAMLIAGEVLWLGAIREGFIGINFKNAESGSIITALLRHTAQDGALSWLEE